MSQRSDSFSSFYSDELVTVGDLVEDCKNLTLDQINNNNSSSIPESKPEKQETSSERVNMDEGCPTQPLAHEIDGAANAEVGDNEEQREILISELVEVHSSLQRTLQNKKFLEELLEEKRKARYENGVELSFADMRKRYGEYITKNTKLKKQSRRISQEVKEARRSKDKLAMELSHFYPQGVVNGVGDGNEVNPWMNGYGNANSFYSRRGDNRDRDNNRRRGRY